MDGALVDEIFRTVIEEKNRKYVTDFTDNQGFIAMTLAPNTDRSDRKINLVLRTKEKGRYNPVDPDEESYAYLTITFLQGHTK